MIDYEKLKLAHELANKTGTKLSYAYQHNDEQYICWVNLDQLILDLQPKPNKLKSDKATKLIQECDHEYGLSVSFNAINRRVGRICLKCNEMECIQ